MKKEIDFDKLSSQLKRTRAQYPARITRAQFAVALKGILNAAEADRLFDYYLHRDVISAVSKTTFVFKQHQEYFSTQSLVELFAKNQIQTRKYCHFRDGDKEQLAKLHERVAATHAKPKMVVALEQVSPEPAVESTIKTLSAFSDEELQDELNRRMEIRKQKERLSTILNVAEITLDELKSLISLVG